MAPSVTYSLCLKRLAVLHDFAILRQWLWRPTMATSSCDSRQLNFATASAASFSICWQNLMLDEVIYHCIWRHRFCYFGGENVILVEKTLFWFEKNDFNAILVEKILIWSRKFYLGWENFILVETILFWLRKRYFGGEKFEYGYFDWENIILVEITLNWSRNPVTVAARLRGHLFFSPRLRGRVNFQLKFLSIISRLSLLWRHLSFQNFQIEIQAKFMLILIRKLYRQSLGCQSSDLTINEVSHQKLPKSFHRRINLRLFFDLLFSLVQTPTDIIIVNQPTNRKTNPGQTLHDGRTFDDHATRHACQVMIPSNRTSNWSIIIQTVNFSLSVNDSVDRID